MKLTHRLVLLLWLCSISIFASAQGVAVNNSGAPADSSAILDMSSTSQGMLMPRMSQAERLAIQDPAEGLMVFQTDDGCIYYFRTGIWWRVCGTPDCSGLNFAVLAGTSGTNPVYLGDSIHLTASVTGGMAPLTFNWTGPAGYSSNLQNPVLTGAQPSMSGSYEVTVTEGHGCTASSWVSITVCGLTVTAGGNSPVVAGSTLNLTATPANGTSPYGFSWTGPGGFTSNIQNPSISNAQPAQSGNYIVTVNDAGGCVAVDTVTISVVTCSTNDSIVFSYTGSMQSWTVPTGLCGAAVFKVWGAQGSSDGGLGGYAQATRTVVAGEVYYIFVGGQSGYNGGGTGASNRNGGGASDIRFGGTTLNHREIVAGGGGADGGAGQGGDGGSGTLCSNGAGGGGGFYPGGSPHAGDGQPGTCTSGGAAGSSYGGWTGGGGGGLSSGGDGSPSGGFGSPGTAGSFGQGGNRGFNSGYPSCESGAGGGGGYYGGGGTADGQCAALGGGGGSSWAASSLSSKVFTGGIQSGNGKIVIKW